MVKEKYALIARMGVNDIMSDGYYTGKSFIFQGARYAVVDRNVSKAKIYSSKARAENASKMGFENYILDIKKLED